MFVNILKGIVSYLEREKTKKIKVTYKYVLPERNVKEFKRKIQSTKFELDRYRNFLMGSSVEHTTHSRKTVQVWDSDPYQEDIEITRSASPVAYPQDVSDETRAYVYELGRRHSIILKKYPSKIGLYVSNKDTPMSKPTRKDRKWWNTDRVATYLGVERSTVTKHCVDGMMRAIQLAYETGQSDGRKSGYWYVDSDWLKEYFWSKKELSQANAQARADAIIMKENESWITRE